MTDLDAIRAILAPLDITPLFQVPSGDLLRGLGGREPDVAVSGVHTEALTASLGAGRRAPVLELELLDKGMAVRVRSVEPRKFAKDLIAGDPDRIEEVFAPAVLSGPEELADLRERVEGIISRQTARRFHERAEASLARAGHDPRKQARALVAAARWCLSGLRLAEDGVVTPALEDLLERSDERWLRELAAVDGRRTLAGSPARAGFYLAETEALLSRLATSIEKSFLPEDPPDTAPIEAWAASI